MQRYKILHRTYYNFSGMVRLGPHHLRLRPREDYELRIESSTLTITPPANLLWHRDVEGNSVATATFNLPTNQLAVESEVIIQQYNEAPLDFLVADYAIDYPFTYQSDDKILLSPYMASGVQGTNNLLVEWIAKIWKPTDRIQTYTLLHQICTHIHKSLSYRVREEPGVQTAEQTLSSATGSCRDFAALFMVVARCLGFAARFVSGYLHAPPSTDSLGSNPCMGRSVPARRGLERVRPHNRRNRRNGSFCRGGGKIARIGSANSGILRRHFGIES
jgi:transglutaminase-like putative cysteine protease